MVRKKNKKRGEVILSKKKTETETQVYNYIGVHIQGNYKKSSDFVAGWATGKGWLGDKPMLSTRMPCGKMYTFETPESFPLEDLGCECGDTTHLVVKWTKVEK